MSYRNNNEVSGLSFSKKVWIAAAIISFFILSFLFLKVIFSLLLLTVAAIIIAVYFHGCAGFIQRKTKASPKWSLFFSITINILLLTVFFWFTGARLQDQLASLSDTLPKTVENAKTYLQKSTLGNKFLEMVKSSGNMEKSMGYAKQFFNSTFGILSDVYIMILLAMFFIASPTIYKKGLITLLPPGAKKEAAALLDQYHQNLKNWLKGQIIGFLFIAILTGLGLWALGMPLILTLALIAGILNVIPNFGPLIALVPAFLIALLQGLDTALMVAAMYTIIQTIQTAVADPLIQKKMLSVPPALLIFAQITMGILGGVWGVLLATPIIAMIMTTVNKLYVEKQKNVEVVKTEITN